MLEILGQITRDTGADYFPILLEYWVLCPYFILKVSLENLEQLCSAGGLIFVSIEQ